MLGSKLSRTAKRAGKAVGLDGQPFAIVIHENEGRRHVHVVWSRIAPERMKAINLPFFKERPAALEKVRIDQLLDEAERHRKANVIRTYVQAALALGGPDRTEWAKWARAQADKLDPLVAEIREAF